MANTWRAVALGVTFASGKSMIDIYHTAADGRFERARRMYQFNNGTAAVTGVLTTMRIERLNATTPTAGTVVVPVAHDTGNAALNAGFTSGTGRTTTPTDVFRQYVWSNDEPAIAGNTIDEWELFVPFAEVWNAGYGESAVQPLVLRGTVAQGLQIRQSGVSAVGSNDFEFEITDEAS